MSRVFRCHADSIYTGFERMKVRYVSTGNYLSGGGGGGGEGERGCGGTDSIQVITLKTRMSMRNENENEDEEEKPFGCVTTSASERIKSPQAVTVPVAAADPVVRMS